jgi:anti-anti-sigma regulatory factor
MEFIVKAYSKDSTLNIALEGNITKCASALLELFLKEIALMDNDIVINATEHAYIDSMVISKFIKFQVVLVRRYLLFCHLK